jgi:hypothetical protein
MAEIREGFTPPHRQGSHSLIVALPGNARRLHHIPPHVESRLQIPCCLLLPMIAAGLPRGRP